MTADAGRRRDEAVVDPPHNCAALHFLAPLELSGRADAQFADDRGLGGLERRNDVLRRVHICFKDEVGAVERHSNVGLLRKAKRVVDRRHILILTRGGFIGLFCSVALGRVPSLGGSLVMAG
jgi:hypothetical protein